MTPYAEADLAMIVRYVPHSRVPEYLALGWIAHDSFVGTHHGEYSVLMEFPLEKGEPVEPEKDLQQ